jgi:hypothetical protein
MLAPVTSTLVAATPGGKTRTMTSARDATLSDPANLLSLTQLTETVSDNGDSSTRVYDAATRTFTMTTAEGRTGMLTLDALGRMKSWRPIRHDAHCRYLRCRPPRAARTGALVQSGYDAATA